MIETLVADEAWIAAAMLQREHPEQLDFSEAEIVGQAHRLGFTRPGVKIHINQHCVANRPPNPGRYRMLLETGKERRRLYRTGDPYDGRRAGSKTTPKAEELPQRWHDLLRWYAQWDAQRKDREDPLMKLWGRGKKYWAKESADAFIERLRSEW